MPSGVNFPSILIRGETSRSDMEVRALLIEQELQVVLQIMFYWCFGAHFAPWDQFAGIYRFIGIFHKYLKSFRIKDGRTKVNKDLKFPIFAIRR